MKGRKLKSEFPGQFLLLLVYFFILISCQHKAPGLEQLEADMLSQMPGAWKVIDENNYEEWKKDDEGNYHAASYAIGSEGKVIFETIRIIRDDRYTYYEATVLGQNEGRPVKFRLVETGQGRMVFTNPGHDFPKRIEFELIGDNRLRAVVSDGKGLDGEHFVINYEKIMKKGRVTGIGGIFFKSEDPGKMRDWYNQNLGLVTNEYGSLFEFRKSDSPEEKAYLQWSPFEQNTGYFEPSKKEFMINYRVENLEELVEELRRNGVTILDSIEVYDYGKFIHILDPENNKIELWEPVDSDFTRSYEGQTTK